MSLLIPSTILGPRPSYASGFARSAGESANPGLWKGLIGAWVPALGVTGSTLFDVSGQHNKGTLTLMDPATDWAPGSTGYALDLDGIDDYLDIPTTPAIPGDMTIAFRALTAVVDSGYLSDFGGDNQFAVIRDFQVGFWNVWGGAYPTGTASDSQIPLTTDIYNSVVWTKKGTALKGYVQGEEQTSVTITSGDFVPSAGLRIGRRYTTGGSSFTGRIESYVLFDRVLNASEVRAHHADHLAMFRLRDRVFAVPGAAPAVGNPWYYYQQQMAGVA